MDNRGEKRLQPFRRVEIAVSLWITCMRTHAPAIGSKGVATIILQKVKYPFNTLPPRFWVVFRTTFTDYLEGRTHVLWRKKRRSAADSYSLSSVAHHVAVTFRHLSRGHAQLHQCHVLHGLAPPLDRALRHLNASIFETLQKKSKVGGGGVASFIALCSSCAV